MQPWCQPHTTKSRWNRASLFLLLLPLSVVHESPLPMMTAHSIIIKKKIKLILCQTPSILGRTQLSSSTCQTEVRSQWEMESKFSRVLMTHLEATVAVFLFICRFVALLLLFSNVLCIHCLYSCMRAWILVHVVLHVSLWISKIELFVFNALVQILLVYVWRMFVCACVCWEGWCGADTGIALTIRFNVSWANAREETTPCDRFCVRLWRSLWLLQKQKRHLQHKNDNHLINGQENCSSYQR